MSVGSPRTRIVGDRLAESPEGLKITLKIVGDPGASTLYMAGGSLRMSFPKRLAAALEFDPDNDKNMQAIAIPTDMGVLIISFHRMLKDAEIQEVIKRLATKAPHRY